MSLSRRSLLMSLAATACSACLPRSAEAVFTPPQSPWEFSIEKVTVRATSRVLHAEYTILENELTTQVYEIMHDQNRRLASSIILDLEQEASTETSTRTVVGSGILRPVLSKKQSVEAGNLLIGRRWLPLIRPCKTELVQKHTPPKILLAETRSAQACAATSDELTAFKTTPSQIMPPVAAQGALMSCAEDLTCSGKPLGMIFVM